LLFVFSPLTTNRLKAFRIFGAEKQENYLNKLCSKKRAEVNRIFLSLSTNLVLIVIFVEMPPL
jgi:hypothetical protein